MSDTDVPSRSLTIPEVARRYRVGWSRVKGWIERGELAALDVRDPGCCKPCFVVTPEALAAFEQRRNAAAVKPPKPKRQPRRKPWTIDFYPD